MVQLLVSQPATLNIVLHVVASNTTVEVDPELSLGKMSFKDDAVELENNTATVKEAAGNARMVFPLHLQKYRCYHVSVLEAATLLVTCNAQPYSRHDWHWRVIVAHRFGHAASVPWAVRTFVNVFTKYLWSLFLR